MPPRKGFARLSPEWWAKWTELDVQTGCRWWTGTKCKLGYGRMWFKGRTGVPAHRAAYEVAYGEFDPSLKVCHTCDNPSCVNPLHLFLGTQEDNLRDMFAKGRARPRGVDQSRGIRRQAPVAPVGLASEISNPAVATMHIVHLTRTRDPIENGESGCERWRQVKGVPPVRPTQAVVLWKRPLEWTGNSQANIDRSRCWPDAADAVCVVGRDRR